MPLLRVQAFLNTRDLEDGIDVLAEPATGTDWLISAGLLDAGARLDAPELEFAREFREGLRALIAEGGQAGADGEHRLAPLRSLAESHRARLIVGKDGNLRLQNAADADLGDRLFELLLIAHASQEDGSWSRLKVCANPECRWVFFDRSRNQQGNWCNMAVCGNRMKNRELRARRR